VLIEERDNQGRYSFRSFGWKAWGVIEHCIYAVLVVFTAGLICVGTYSSVFPADAVKAEGDRLAVVRKRADEVENVRGRGS
jgi:hypothetical protein